VKFSVPINKLTPVRNNKVTVYDLFQDQGIVIGKFSDRQSLELLVPVNGVRMVKLIPDN
jgi:hypothetical protein